MRLADLYQQVEEQFLKAEIESASYEARVLVGDILSLDLTKLVLCKDQIISQSHIEEIQLATKRRVSGEPLAYVLGEQFFFKDMFFVNKDVLIPRPETELLVEIALQKKDISQIADWGCGSGCIGLSIAKYNPNVFLTGIDISDKALAVAKKNAKRLGLEKRAVWLHSDILVSLAPTPLNLIVANPPYIGRDDLRLDPSVRLHEPELALFAEHEGLGCYETWTPKAFHSLSPGGFLIYEVGAGQARQVASICLQNGFKNIRIVKDLSGIERVVEAQRET